MFRTLRLAALVLLCAGPTWAQAAPAEPAPSPDATTASRVAPAAGSARDEESGPQAGSAPDSAGAQQRDLSNPDKQIDAAFSRYMWIVPHHAGHRASLGIALFAFVAGVLLFSARVANVDGMSFGHAAGASAAILSVASLEVALVPRVAPAIVLTALFDVGLWFAMTRALRVPVFAGVVMFVTSAFLVVLAILGLGVAGTLLDRSAIMG